MGLRSPENSELFVLDSKIKTLKKHRQMRTGKYKTDSTNPVKILKGKSFIAYRTPNPAARILLIHRIKTITKKGTMVTTTLGHVC